MSRTMRTRVKRTLSDGMAMQLDDDICYCYHVSLRKLIHFSRREQPLVPSRMTECLGAGTGCGWCIPFLVKIARDPDAFQADDIVPQSYAAGRQAYIQDGSSKNKFAPENEPDSKGSCT